MISLIISYSISKRTSNKLILQTEYIPIRQKWANSSKCDGQCHIKRVVEKENFRHVCIYLSITHKKYGSIGLQRTVFFQPVIIFLSCRALVFAQFPHLMKCFSGLINRNPKKSNTIAMRLVETSNLLITSLKNVNRK